MLVSVQGFPIVVTPPSAQRRDRFRAHILALLEEPAGAGESLEHESQEPPSSLLAAACRLCRGLCCRYGGDEAHLDAAPLRRLRARRPDLRDSDILALYTNAIPARTVERSCIAHGESGCSLPRALRSPTCNEFHCVPLRQLREHEQAEAHAGPAVMLVVQAGEVLRSAVLRR